MEQTGNLLIRADAGPAIGAGHVMRCLALAQRWLDDGGRVTFACSELPGAIGQRLRAEGCVVTPIHAPIGSQADAASTAALAGELDGRVVLDGYRFDLDYQATIRRSSRALLVLDDDAQIGSYDCDMILDQNLGAAGDAYRHRPESCRLLLGVGYAMLRREFLQAAADRREPSAEVAGVLVATGGADIGGVAIEVLETLERVPGSIDVTVVRGGAAAADEKIEGIASSSHHRVLLIHNVSDITGLMAAADLAVSCAGSTAWELAFMGVPSVLIPVAPNQEPIARGLDSEGAAVAIDSASRIIEVLPALIADHPRRLQMSRRGRALIDGRGARRVANAVKAAVAESAKVS